MVALASGSHHRESSFAEGRDGDGGDGGRGAVELAVAFGQDADGGQVILLELVGEQAEPPAEHHHVGGGERAMGSIIDIRQSPRVWVVALGPWQEAWMATSCSARSGE